MKSLLNTLQKLPGIPAFLIGIVLIFHCTPDPGSVIRSGKTLPPGILAFLNTAADSQYVVLKTVAKNPKKNKQQFLNVEVPLLEKAQVSLTDGSKSFTLDPVYMENPEDPFSLADGIVRYWASTEPIRPGESYWLKVSIPEKGDFDATTTAPGDFEILSPVNGDTVDVSHPIEVKWTAARGAAGYRVCLWAFIEFQNKLYNKDGTYWNGHNSLVIQSSPDTTLKLQHYLDHFYTPPRDTMFISTLLRAVLTIDALDEPAWTAYCIKKDQDYSDSDFRVDPVSYSNINGGWGLMTAATTKYVELLLPEGQK